MSYFRFFQFPQLPRLGWRGQIGLILAVALGLAAAVALVIVSVGLALVLLPVAAVAVLIGRWRVNRMMNEARRKWEEQQQKRSSYIDTEFTVVDDEKDKRNIDL